MSEDTIVHTIRHWLPGDRVTRMVFFDDGTWEREGDKCLSQSPLRRGVVTHRSVERTDEVWVKFDDGGKDRFLDHGLNADTSTVTERVVMGFRCNECGLEGNTPKVVVQERAGLSGEVTICPECGSEDIDIGEFTLEDNT
jgi:hypothetical protein